MSASILTLSSLFAISRPAAILGVPRKTAIIRLRWPVVIICSYLLLYSHDGRLEPVMVHGFLLLYVLSNAALYWVEEELFSSSYFYAPLVLFDTLFLTASLSLSGQVGADFYLAYFLTIVLCAVCKDIRGWIVITFLSPLVYGYYLFQSVERLDPSLYLRIPFPFVVALFYGYFAQLENFTRRVEEDAERAAQGEEAQAQIQRQLERIRTLSQINLAITSSLDFNSVLAVLQERVDLLLPNAATVVWLVNRESGELNPVACSNLDEQEWRSYPWGGRGLTTAVFRSRQPLVVTNLLLDRRTWNPDWFRRHGLLSFLGVPLLVKDEVLGVVSFYTKVEHEFTGEEVEFFSALAAQAAIAIHNSQLYEQTKMQAIALERSNRVKDNFLSTMSHELRTPLNAIMGYAGMIKDGILGGINPEQEESLERVMARSQDLFAMISGILQATSLEAEAIKAESQPVGLTELLDELRATYGAPLNKEVTLAWDYPSDLPVIRTDKDKLKQVLRHLIHNGIKFMPRGQVIISARHLPEDKRVAIAVNDSGIGIPQEYLPVIFEKFRQVNNSETRAHSGIGLGLYVAKRLTELLGGTIQVESEPGKGSIFTVTLPT